MSINCWIYPVGGVIQGGKKMSPLLQRDASTETRFLDNCTSSLSVQKAPGTTARSVALCSLGDAEWTRVKVHILATFRREPLKWQLRKTETSLLCVFAFMQTSKESCNIKKRPRTFSTSTESPKVKTCLITQFKCKIYLYCYQPQSFLGGSKPNHITTKFHRSLKSINGALFQEK